MAYEIVFIYYILYISIGPILVLDRSQNLATLHLLGSKTRVWKSPMTIRIDKQGSKPVF